MNTETGEIIRLDAEMIATGKFQEIKEEQMTSKQSQLMQVSKFDSKSELGNIFTSNRAERRRQEKEYRKEMKRARKLGK